MATSSVLDGSVRVPSPFLGRDYPEDPYPGARPGASFAELDGIGWVLDPRRDAASGWCVLAGEAGPVDLDAWLESHRAATLDERLPVLAYGSNGCPGKVTWMRRAYGLGGPAVVMRADVDGVSAVWAAGVRARDGQRPAVLAANPGVTERHAVWFATPQQRAVLDRVEGRGSRYRLAWVHASVTIENGARHDWILAYVARSEVLGVHVAHDLNRSPLLAGGGTVRVADVGQAAARALAGIPADSDGLDAVEVHGEPSWSDIAIRRPLAHTESPAPRSAYRFGPGPSPAR